MKNANSVVKKKKLFPRHNMPSYSTEMKRVDEEN